MAVGQKLSVEAPYDRIPVFVREGSIIPTVIEMQHAVKQQESSYTIFVYTGKDALFNLYEDDGISDAYKNGEFDLINFKYSEKEKPLIVSDREGKFEGMLENRIFNIIEVPRNKPSAFFSNTNEAPRRRS